MLKSNKGGFYMNRKRIITIILIGASIISLGVNSYAHSGRTDSSGGHKDNQIVKAVHQVHRLQV